jgi:ureidoacrylate peracid hydrolase
VSDLAVILIDLQNTYLADDGERERLGWPPIWNLDATVRECQALATTARARGIPIIYTRQLGTATAAHSMPSLRALRAARDGAPPPLSTVPAALTWKQQIIDAVAPEPGDIIVDKLRYDAFLYTELEPVLKNLGVTRLLVAGLQTNVCVESTVRTALQLNYLVAVADDAVSTDGEDLHWAGLTSMKVMYTEVAPWRELLDEPWTRFTAPYYGREAMNPAKAN